MLALYLWVLIAHEGDSWQTAAPFATLLGFGVLAAAIAAFLPNDPFRIVAAAAAAAVFLAGAILGAMSIGLLLVPPALAALVCVSSTGERLGLRASWAAAAAAGGGALGLIVFYLALWL